MRAYARRGFQENYPRWPENLFQKNIVFEYERHGRNGKCELTLVGAFKKIIHDDQKIYFRKISFLNKKDLWKIHVQFTVIYVAPHSGNKETIISSNSR